MCGFGRLRPWRRGHACERAAEHEAAHRGAQALTRRGVPQYSEAGSVLGANVFGAGGVRFLKRRHETLFLAVGRELGEFLFGKLAPFAR
jgi:hypothetical protein